MRRRFRLRRPIARTAMRAQSAALGEQAQNKRRTSAEVARDHVARGGSAAAILGEPVPTEVLAVLSGTTVVHAHAATPALGKAGYPRAS